MSRYDFDKVTDRRGTSSMKYDGGPEIAGRDDLLPMWVADMDFPLPQEILKRLHERVDHGIFGYSMPDKRYYDTLEKWFAGRYAMPIKREWVSVVPGVVYAITCAIRALTDPGEAIMIQEPVYYPFRTSIEKNGRICINCQLAFDGSRYRIDFEGFEKRIEENDVRVFILCSPHNPVGRVWTQDELERIADICMRHDVTVISDEIHCDFIFSGHTFTSFGQLDEKYASRAVICTAPSKSFNIAGLQISNILIQDEKIREAFRQESSANGYGNVGAMALCAAQACYELGGPWLDELVSYVEGNIRFMQDYLQRHIPQVRMIRPEGTYLVWVDFSRVADTPDQMREMIQGQARLWLDNGGMFSEKTWMFERFNLACPRSILEQALKQLESGVKARLDKCYSTELIMEWYRDS